MRLGVRLWLLRRSGLRLRSIGVAAAVAVAVAFAFAAAVAVGVGVVSAKVFEAGIRVAVLLAVAVLFEVGVAVAIVIAVGVSVVLALSASSSLSLLRSSVLCWRRRWSWRLCWHWCWPSCCFCCWHCCYCRGFPGWHVMLAQNWAQAQQESWETCCVSEPRLWAGSARWSLRGRLCWGWRRFCPHRRRLCPRRRRLCRMPGRRASRLLADCMLCNTIAMCNAKAKVCAGSLGLQRVQLICRFGLRCKVGC